MAITTATLPRRPLPIGIQTFAKLREADCFYVNKTGMAIDLIESGGAFFLSRPRRFGKSLLVDTFKELFEANRPLFTGLAAEASRPTWSASSSVGRHASSSPSRWRRSRRRRAERHQRGVFQRSLR